jgi:hypothetical protein
MIIKKYRKIPVVIEAVAFEYPNYPSEVADWCGGRVKGLRKIEDNIWIEIDTPEGVMRASYGDYIIKGVNGEFYPCKPEIFTKTYEDINPFQGKE